MASKNKLYVVHAYRFGDRECHSYQLGVFNRKQAALNAAKNHSDYRGGKYECEVMEWVVNDLEGKTILPLPPTNLLARG